MTASSRMKATLGRLCVSIAESIGWLTDVDEKVVYAYLRENRKRTTVRAPAKKAAERYYLSGSIDIRALVLVRTAEIHADPMPISPLPPPLLEVAGKSALQRMIERLRHFGLQHVTVVSDSDSPPENSTKGHAGNYVTPVRERFWRVAENAFCDFAQDGAELVLLIGLGGYSEVDFEELVQFHLDGQARVSQACRQGRPLEVFCISALRRNDAASLFRSQLTKCRVECRLFDYAGYFNPLSNARDLRQFAIDILTLRTQTQPSGSQLRPGVWLERGARLEKGARVLAPAFIGAFAKIRTHAVITRCSSVEHHAEVDPGSIVENSTVLPCCRVGAGLDVAHSVVGNGIYANLRRNVYIQIPDPQLISRVSATSGLRFLSAAREFAAYLLQAWRALFRPTAGTTVQPTDHAAFDRLPPRWAMQAYGANAAEEFPSDLEVARRYGDQE